STARTGSSGLSKDSTTVVGSAWNPSRTNLTTVGPSPGAGATTRATAFETLPGKVAWPLATPATGWGASGSFVDKVAWATPLRTTSFTAGCAVPSMKKVTVPVGVPVVAVTVAVRVTTWPTTDGFGVAVSCIVVAVPVVSTTSPSLLAADSVK